MNYAQLQVQGFMKSVEADEEAIKCAHAFMKDNGYKYTSIGKICACNDLADAMADDPEQAMFWQGIIVRLEDPNKIAE